MEAETLFILLGLALTGMALVISLIGIRTESFPPSPGAMLAGIGLFVLVVGATATFAWQGAEDEQEHRNEEIAAGEHPSPADVVEELRAASAEAAAEDDADAEGEGEEPTTAPADGEALFTEQGCADCHILEAAGSTGDIGPDLDIALKAQDTAFIEEAIVDPEAEIAKGFPAGTMPGDFGELMSPEELDALVAYIAESAGAKK